MFFFLTIFRLITLTHRTGLYGLMRVNCAYTPDWQNVVIAARIKHYELIVSRLSL